VQYIGERQLYVTFSLSLSFYRIGNGKRESKKEEEREYNYQESILYLILYWSFLKQDA